MGGSGGVLYDDAAFRASGPGRQKDVPGHLLPSAKSLWKRPDLHPREGGGGSDSTPPDPSHHAREQEPAVRDRDQKIRGMIRTRCLRRGTTKPVEKISPGRSRTAAAFVAIFN